MTKIATTTIQISRTTADLLDNIGDYIRHTQPELFSNTKPSKDTIIRVLIKTMEQTAQEMVDKA